MISDSSEFKHQSVRDLAWAVASPPLITQPEHGCLWPDSRWYQQAYLQTLPWLNALDDDPAELDNLLAGQKDRRLGKYFETLWYFWLSHHPRYQIIENNLQVIIDGETLGEIDFIVLDKKTKQVLHWEVAIKFYLGVGDTAEMSNWHGPNLRDRLDIKVDHLLHRQSTITNNPRVAEWLAQRGIRIDGCAVILKGRLYYPWHSDVSWSDSSGRTSPALCSADHLRGWWLNTEQFEQRFDNKQRFMPLINSGWLEKIPTNSVKKFYTKKRIFETLSNKILRLPLHLMLCDLEHTRDRVFLTAKNWP